MKFFILYFVDTWIIAMVDEAVVTSTWSTALATYFGTLIII